ncbi:MAG: chordopoxvirus fusion protein [Desulfobacterota bacterium]|nr:chordopoxvirus fusion protein [Thermodesulfobacteriota bacterium]MDW8002673.1 chordopoxvirus fusion protein [Deltaproteobacteria bacterium]
MLLSVEVFEELEKLEPTLRSVLITIFKSIEKSIGEAVKKEDFTELKKEVNRLAELVRELAEAQKRTELKLSELAEAQKRTELTIGELAGAQKKTEIRLNELAEAQKKTEERLNELAEAQRKTEIRLNELAEAQKKTEERLNELAIALKRLTDEHQKTRENLGGLAHTVGYLLENEAYKYLPALLKKDLNVEVVGELIRDYVKISPEHYEEVNIIGKGRANGKELVIIGEVKTQLTKADVTKFLNKVNKLSKIFPVEKLLICVTHQVHPLVKNYAEEKGIKVYLSYQFK